MKRIISLILCLMLCAGLMPAYAADIAALTAAAEAGDLRAMDDLASAYYYGEGVAQDYNLAAYWWYKGAEAGDPSCMDWIGTMFYYGEGVEQNRQEALKWTKKAAQGGDPYAVFYMGYITARGTDVFSVVELETNVSGRRSENFIQIIGIGAIVRVV